MEKIFDYDGFIEITETDDVDRNALRNLAAQRPGAIEIYKVHLEIRYTGRDTNRHFVELLKQLAAIIKNAEGEVRCAIEGDDGRDPQFEIYSFVDGMLFMQQGKIVRGPRMSLPHGPDAASREREAPLADDPKTGRREVYRINKLRLVALALLWLNMVLATALGGAWLILVSILLFVSGLWHYWLQERIAQQPISTDLTQRHR